MKKPPKYPRISKLGLQVEQEAIQVGALKSALGDQYDRFGRLFGYQTGIVKDGEMCVFASDVEAVLERMATGKRTGSQLIWD